MVIDIRWYRKNGRLVLQALYKMGFGEVWKDVETYDDGVEKNESA